MERKETGEEKTSTINISQKERRKGIFVEKEEDAIFFKGERVFREQKSSWHSICDSKKNEKKKKKLKRKTEIEKK